MSLQSPFRLEINIISAHDLPPVSKMLRTFAVAYINPDEKLTTKIDHQGHTNPTWNYKVVFHVGEKFLKQESSAVTIEIYNLAWLRDLPIGTTRLLINNLSPPLNKNPNFRRVALRLCRPSGHLQGTLNLGVQLVDNAILGKNMCLLSLRNVDQEEEETHDHDRKEQGNDFDKKEDDNIPDQERNPGPDFIPRIESVGATPDSRYTTRLGSEYETKTIASSAFSVMKPLPSEVADDLKKGIYTSEWTEYGSSIFENWTENGDSKSDDHGIKQEIVQWPSDELISLTTERKHDCIRIRRPEKKNGLFSCFGSAYGFQFSIICGSNQLKNKNKNKNKNKIRNVNKQNVLLTTGADENLRKFYV